MQFSENLQDLLLTHGLNAETLAKNLNIKSSRISEWLRNIYLPSIEHAKIIADYFNCSLDYLFCLTEHKEKSKTYNDKAFYETLIFLLKTKNMSNYKLCKSAKISQSNNTKWRSGTIPDIKILLKIVKVLDCSLDYLVGCTK